ncbi:mucin-17 [Trichomycterus rosablanca]|uniref:mucin-17 n=1 Tax=Trichomycterus rosablanca TaxID=2290929 RepID=UPI002F35D898
MTGGSEKAAGNKDDGPTLTAQVPVGWQRKVEDGAVVYISPSATVLCSVEEVRAYLLADGTCKCGLECPLVLHKVFNFDPTAGVQAPSHQSGKVEEDMTKLCNHRRKVVAMAALCRSMRASQIPPLAHATGSAVCLADVRDQRVSVATRGVLGQCTYSTQLNSNQARLGSSSSFSLPSSLSLMQNGSVSHPEQSSPIKKPPTRSPGPSIAAYGKQQWSACPAITQTVLQRAPHKPPSPSTTKLETHTYQMNSPHPASFSSPTSSSSPVMGRTGQLHPHPQGTIVKSPSPMSMCSSPSRAQDFSPHQRSRHSSTSSLSEGAMLTHGVKPSPSPLSPNQSCSSPKLSLPPTSPCSRLEGILQHYKECNSANPDSTQHHTLSSQSKLPTLQNQQAANNTPCDRRNGPASAPGLMGLQLGQILCQQKSQQHISTTFPASSLLSAAAKANQKSQGLSGASDMLAIPPLTGLDKEQQSKVLISTLNSSLHTPAARTQSLTAFLLPHSPSLPVSTPALSEKTLRRKRPRCSPTVLSMLKESQMNRTPGDLPISSLTVPPLSPSPSSPPASTPHSENHLQSLRLYVAPPPIHSMTNSILRQPEWEEGKRTALANSLPLSTPPASSQPLSALLQLISMQSAQNVVHSNSTSAPTSANKNTAAPPPTLTQAPQYDGQLGSQMHLIMKQPQPQSLVPTPASHSQLPTPLPFSLTCEDTEGVAVNLKMTPNNAVLNLSRPQTGTRTELSVSSQTHGVIGQLSSATCLPTSTYQEKSCASRPGEMGLEQNVYQTDQPSHGLGTENEGPVISEEQQNLETRLLDDCDADPNLSLPPAPCSPSSDLPNSSADAVNTLQLAESFPFMTQEQLLQLLSSNAGLPSLLPPFLGSVPLGLWTGGQAPMAGSTQPPQSANSLLNQTSPLTVLPSTLGAQGDPSFNLVSLLNPPAPGSPLASSPEAGEKNPGLQALLVASFLFGQNPAAMLPLPGLNVDLPLPQQVFGEGVSLEKNPALLDSLLMGPGLLEALQALAPPADGQSLLLSAQLTSPPPLPPAFLSMNPALLATALAQAETLPNHTPYPQPHTQGTLSSPGLVSTSLSCAPLVRDTGQEVCDSLDEHEKTNAQTPQFLPALLPQGVLGDLAALGNINSLQSLLSAGPLLLSQAPSLGMPLPQNQAALNPLTCLQLSMASTLMGEKSLAVHENNPAQEEFPSSQLSQESLLNPGHLQPSAQPREEAAGADPGLLDPYGSFMDTIYTSFLQVSGRGPEGESDSTALSYPELPPSLSPRRACSVHNPDLSRLSMEAAQSPARGTPKLSEDPPTTPPCKQAEPRPPDAPMHLTFMEEAKTDNSAKLGVYSNGISSAVGIEDDDKEERSRQQQGYLSPKERVNMNTMADTLSNTDTEHATAIGMHIGTRRGRKRKQTLQRGSEIPEDLERIIEEPVATIALERPAKGKRRRVLR